MPTNTFTKFKFSRPLTYWLFTKWFGKQLGYGEKSIAKMKQLLKDESFDLLHAQFGDNGVRILPLAKQLNVPMVVSFHGFDASRKLSNRVYREGLKDVFDYASAIIICNTGMADILPLSEDHKKKVHWVPYGIDIDQFTADTSAIQPNSFNILHVGRLIEKKGVPDLIRAFASATKEADQMTLHIVGTGRERNECFALVKEYNLESKVVFHGWKSPKEVKELMQQCEVFVLNSRVAGNGETEGLPVGLLEAMAMGRAVISTRHAGIPLAVENEVSGLLVDERDTDSLSQQLLRLYHNKELRQTLGKAARAKVENQFTMKRMHENLRDIYCEIVNK
ncbi:MAG: glycosyltransferase family 4 protein [Cyclobacteriaceae bacterium]|nr:glycosyltransferase family 4 protein [Cyclobacteriaceae bacterium]